MFPGFLHPFKIEYVNVTPGYTNQTTQAWVDETRAAAVIIQGVLSEITIQDMRGSKEGVLEIEDRKITLLSTIGMKKKDELNITENVEGTVITHWHAIYKLYSPKSSIRSLLLDYETFAIREITQEA